MTVDWLYNQIGETFSFLQGSDFLFFISALLPSAIIITLMAVNAIVMVYAEMKVSAFMQDRMGPMGQGPGLHAGKFGILQPIADPIKLLLKEDTIPTVADKPLFVLAPFIIFVGAVIGFLAVPFNQDLIVVDLNIGIFYIMAVGSFAVIGLILAGWSSNNKWSLYGGMRSAAQIISYEIPAGLCVITVIMLAGSLNMQEIIQYQNGGISNWIIFDNPFSFISFFIFFICIVAETNRTPFDISEAESELVGGFHTEYSGFRWSMFFLSEYANMLVVCFVASAGFLGGWQSPFEGFMDTPVWGVFWMLSKVLSLMFVMMWFRWTFPRLRVDQLMYICWKVFIPISLINIFGVGIWTLLFG